MKIFFKCGLSLVSVLLAVGMTLRTDPPYEPPRTTHSPTSGPASTTPSPTTGPASTTPSPTTGPARTTAGLETTTNAGGLLRSVTPWLLLLLAFMRRLLLN